MQPLPASTKPPTTGAGPVSWCPRAAPHGILAGPALVALWQLRGCGQSRCHPRAAVLMFYVPSMGVSFPLWGELGC